MKSTETPTRKSNYRKWKIPIIVAIIVSVILVIAIQPLAFWAYKVFYHDVVLSKIPEPVRPWADPEWFYLTWYSKIPMVTYSVIAFLWLAVGLLLLRSRNFKGASVLLLVLLTVSTVSYVHILAPDCIPNAEGQYSGDWNYVDVLCIGDQIFMANPDWITSAEQTLVSVNAENFAESNIKFVIRGWQTWDSSYSSDMYVLYQEAIQESGLPIEWIELDPEHIPGFYGWGFVSGSEWTDTCDYTWLIDLLLIFSYEGDMFGLSVPTCNATIVRYDAVNLRDLTHELGHQYWLEHCSGTCVMHAPPSSDNFCSDCQTELMGRRDKWKTDCRELTVTKSGNGVIDISEVDNAYWFSPTGHEDTPWVYEYRAYDGYILDGVYAIDAKLIDPGEWTDWLILTFPTSTINLIRFIGYGIVLGRGAAGVYPITLYLDVYNGVSWKHAYTGDIEYTKTEWQKRNFASISGNKIRMKFTPSGFIDRFYIIEVELGYLSSEEGTYTFLHNTVVEITATPDDGYYFNYWILDGSTKYGNEITVTMNSDHDLKAYFNPYLTVLAEDQYGDSLTTGDVYIDDELVGYIGSTYEVGYGTHTVFVNDFWEEGVTGYRYGFDHWEDGSVNNPRSIEVTEPTIVTACFNKKWCPGDVNGDGKVNYQDLSMLSAAYGSIRGGPNWNSCCDFDADGDVDYADLGTLSRNYGNVYE